MARELKAPAYRDSYGRRRRPLVREGLAAQGRLFFLLRRAGVGHRGLDDAVADEEGQDDRDDGEAGHEVEGVVKGLDHRLDGGVAAGYRGAGGGAVLVEAEDEERGQDRCRG